MNHPKSILTKAAHALDADRPKVAHDLLAPLVSAQPKLAEGQFLMARALAALGHVDGARGAFDAALDLAPKAPAVWLDFALFAHRQGDGSAIVRRAKAAGLKPDLIAMISSAASGQGVRAHGTGDIPRKPLQALARTIEARDARAAARAEAALKGKPGPASLGLIGQARLLRGAAAEAEAAFRAGLKQAPMATDLHLGLARALAGQGKTIHAVAEARRAALAAPAWPQAQVVFARLALGAGLADHALTAAEAALAVAPKADAARVLAVEAALAAKRADQAVVHAEALAPNVPDRAVFLARALGAAQRSDEALAAWQAAGDTPENRTARAQLLQSLGRTDEAEAVLRKVLEDAPKHGRAARALAYGTRLAPDDPALAAMRDALATASQDDKRLLHYALARALERHDPDEAAAHLAKANTATAARWPHDPAADRADLDRVIGPEWTLLKDVAPSDCPATPIFVTGLPRSGTTLVETILAAHPSVAQGGELGVLRRALTKLRQDMAAGQTPTADALRAAGDSYADAAARTAGTPDPTLRLTDKSIHSFVHLGAIGKILPKSHMVVVHRDPRDTGLSIWRNDFADGQHRYAATWDGIADHIALFRDAVAFWRSALPAGTFHEIEYEALLNDPETETRRLVAACGLPWDDACLSFHEKAGRVDTLSFAQVRQPIYKTSKGGWQAAGNQVKPLIEALEARRLID
ncbi:MAG: sulfotransferase [Pseudomonadota bacterium]